jgi:hypothetical protein
VLRPLLGLRAAQPRVDVARGLLAVTHADRHGPLGGHHVAAGEHARAAGHERCRHAHGAVALQLHPRQLPQECGIGLLPERKDDGVRGDGLEPAGRLRIAGLVELHDLDLQLGSLERGDRPQPVDPHALALRVHRLVRVRRHLLARAPVDDQRLVGAHAPRHARRVHRGVAATVDRHAPADHRPLAGRHVAEERDGVDDRAGVPGRDVDALGQMRAHRDEDRVEAALVALGGEIGHAMSARHANAQRRDAIQLSAEDVARQAVGRDAVAHHAAGLRAGVADLDLVAEPGQVVRRRPAARPGADHEHALAGPVPWRIERPPALDREVAEKALDRMDRDRAVELGAIADALARVVADAAVDRRQRVVRDELAPGVLVPAGLHVREPGLDVLARRAAGVARRQQVDVDGPALAHRPRARVPVQQIGERSDVPCGTRHASHAHPARAASSADRRRRAAGNYVRLNREWGSS